MTNVKSFKWLKTITVVLFAMVYVAIYTVPVFAAELTTASVSLSDPRTGGTSSYTAQVSGLSTATTINCIELDLGTSVDGSGEITGTVDLSGVTLTSTSIPSAETWVDATVDGTTDQLRATNATGATPNASGNVIWAGVVNGSTEGVTYYGVLTTYTNTDCSTGPTDTVVMAFNYKNGEPVSLTIDPSLTFTCAGVAASQEIFPVGGASLNTNVLSNGAGIDHGSNVTTSLNGISAHDLTTATNASGGMTVSVRHTGSLTNAATDTIDEGTPLLSEDAFPAAGTDESWAWTTDDDDVGTYNNSGAGLWTSFSTTNATIVSTAGAPQVSTTDRVGHQVGIQGDTAAGTYTTTIIYTAVAVY